MRSFVLSRAREANYSGVLQEIVQMIGAEAASKLVAKLGGTCLYIPVTPKPKSQLCQLIGQEAAQQLADEFGGITVEIPLDHIERLAQRNKLIMADRATGMSQSKIALKYHLSTRWIRKIIVHNQEERKS